MPYSTVDDVKIRLNIPTSDNSFDQEIQHFIEEADAMIDDIHKRLGISTPIQNPSDRLRRLSADIAADLYMMWNSRDPELRVKLREEIRKMLKKYERDLAPVTSTGVSLTAGGELDV